MIHLNKSVSCLLHTLIPHLLHSELPTFFMSTFIPNLLHSELPTFFMSTFIPQSTTHVWFRKPVLKPSPVPKPFHPIP
ncbi:hypothetical protein BC829DRAFT_269469 [Chytridium lagenaria]|nr:hypothetical protein BC829DRAFT_269469 [Chytridium lagenaria]